MSFLHKIFHHVSMMEQHQCKPWTIFFVPRLFHTFNEHKRVLVYACHLDLVHISHIQIIERFLDTWRFGIETPPLPSGSNFAGPFETFMVFSFPMFVCKRVKKQANVCILLPSNAEIVWTIFFINAQPT